MSHISLFSGVGAGLVGEALCAAGRREPYHIPWPVSMCAPHKPLCPLAEAFWWTGIAIGLDLRLPDNGKGTANEIFVACLGAVHDMHS